VRIPSPRSAAWALVGASAALVASTLTERSIDAGYRATRGRRSPLDPRRRNAGWPETILFTLGSAAVVGLAQLMARRGTEAGWTRVTGRKPPRR
jgi:hypothetical protein